MYSPWGLILDSGIKFKLIELLGQNLTHLKLIDVTEGCCIGTQILADSCQQVQLKKKSLMLYDIIFIEWKYRKW